MSLPTSIDRLLGGGYFLLFRRPPKETAQKLLRNIFYNVGGIAGGTLLTFLFSIWAIRMMGPSEYGKANIVISTASFFITFLLFGHTNSAMRYLAREPEKRGEILGSILTNVFILFALFLPLFWIAKPFAMRFLHIESDLYLWALGYSVILAGYYLTEAIMRGIDEFKKLAGITIVSAVFFSGVIAVSAGILKVVTFEHYLAASGLRWSVFAIMAASIILPLARGPSRRWMSNTLHFGVYHVGMYLAGFFLFFSIDSLMLNYYLGETAVGIYAAYYMTFNVFAGKLFQPIIDVFYPMASALDDVRTLFDRIIQAAKKLLPLIFIASILLTAALFQFYGRGYPFRWGLAALMAANISLYIVTGLMSSLIGSRGIAGARFLFTAIALAALINVAANAALIPRWGLAGVMLATTAASLMLLGSYWKWLSRDAVRTAS